ncbi:hypothetical protein AAVH_29068, partial [Aphelenchoides avenae]
MSSAVDGFVPHDIASVANQLWFILSIFALSAIILVGNGVLFLTVALTGRLRVHKEYCILAATMLADFMYGLTFILSSLRWLKTYFFAAEYLRTMSPLECVWQLHLLLQLYILPCCFVIILTATFDRFCSVMFPFWYTKLSNAYTIYALLISFVLPLMYVAVAIVAARNGFESKYRTNEYCILPFVVPRAVIRSQLIFALVASIMAIVFHIPIAYRICQLYSYKAEFVVLKRAERERLLRTTLTVALVILGYLLLMFVPEIVALVQVPMNVHFAAMILRHTK